MEFIDKLRKQNYEERYRGSSAASSEDRFNRGGGDEPNFDDLSQHDAPDDMSSEEYEAVIQSLERKRLLELQQQQ